MTSSGVSADRITELREAVEREMPGLRSDLESLVRIPSVSASAFDQSHVDASAEAVAALLRGAGMQDVDILREGGAPAVVGLLRLGVGDGSQLGVKSIGLKGSTLPVAGPGGKARAGPARTTIATSRVASE